MFNNSDGCSTILTDVQQFCPTLNNSGEKIVEPLNAQPLNKSDGYTLFNSADRSANLPITLQFCRSLFNSAGYSSIPPVTLQFCRSLFNFAEKVSGRIAVAQQLCSSTNLTATRLRRAACPEAVLVRREKTFLFQVIFQVFTGYFF